MTKPVPHEPAFTPFADDSAVRTIGAISFENGRDAIAVHGTLDISHDAAGLSLARMLKTTVDRIVATLESEDLPREVAETSVPPTIVKNPFA